MRILMVAAAGLAFTSCTEPVSDSLPKAQEQVQSAAQPPAQPRYGELTAVPTELLGQWQFVREDCEEGQEPRSPAPAVSMRLDENFRYEMDIEGWRVVGQFRVDRFQGPALRVQFRDNMLNFNFEDGRLVNGSEGDAVYLCTRTFEHVDPVNRMEPAR